MMRFASLLFPAAVLFASCSNNSAPEKKEAATSVPYDYSKLEGRYRGDFGGSGDILVVLRHVTDRNAVGYDMHKGLRRNISGEFTPADKGFKFVLHEPGDNKFDGIFEFTLDTSNRQITGTWKPANNPDLGNKSYTLKKDMSDTVAIAQNEISVFADSLGELNFEEGGLCIYRYYPKDANGKTAEQFLEIKGNWKMVDEKYMVDWQKNQLFSNKQSIFKPVKEDGENYYYIIEGEGRKFYGRGL